MWFFEDGKDLLLKISKFLLNDFKGLLFFEGKHEDDALDGVVEFQRKFVETGNVYRAREVLW